MPNEIMYRHVLDRFSKDHRLCLYHVAELCDVIQKWYEKSLLER
jgi:hypothetical protein